MIATSLAKTLTAGVLSFTLAVTSITPTTASAQWSDEEAVAGFLTLLLLGAAIHNSRNNDRAAPQPSRHPQPDRPRRDWRVLPAQCLTSIDTRRGESVRLFSQRCLNNNYRFTNRLPQECFVRVRAENGERLQGYRARCMRNAGFRTDRR